MNRRQFNLLALSAMEALSAEAQNAAAQSLAEAAEPRRTGMARPNGTYLSNSYEQIDLLSGNLNITIPLIEASSRRLKQNFMLSYNSQLWELNAGGVRRQGVDVGLGAGWRIQAGSIVPTVAPGGLNVIGYTFVDFSGAEYPMVPGAGLTWETRQGLHVTFDPVSARLMFNTGTVWTMGSVSAVSEADAGARYPTLMQDSNGNQILISYLPGQRQLLPNTSSRIGRITDARAASTASGRQTYSFVYNADAAPRLLSIMALIPTSETYNFSYASVALQAPFGPKGSPTLTQSVSGFGTPGQPGYVFGYSADQTGEIVSMVNPTGGRVDWAYASESGAGGTTVRVVTKRILASNPLEKASPTHEFSFARTAGQDANGPTAQVSLEAGTGGPLQEWVFAASSAAWRRGLCVSSTNLEPNGTILQHKLFEWTQSANGDVYRSAVTTVLNPGAPGEAKSRTEVVQDAHGNTTRLSVFDHGDFSKPVRVADHTFVSTPSYVSAHLRWLLQSSKVTVNGVTSTARSNVYDSTPLISTAGLSEHDGKVDLSVALRGNLTETVVSGKYSRRIYDTTGTVVEIQDELGSSMTLVPAADLNHLAPGSLVPNGNSLLATSLAYDAALRPILQTDSNGNPTRLGYDERGRLISLERAGEDPITYSYGFSPSTVTTTIGSAWTRRTLDGFGRVVKSERGTGAGPATHRADFEYDAIHQSKVSRVSGWYSVGDTPSWKTMTYDALGRLTRMGLRENSGAVGFRYSGRTKTRIGPSGRAKSLVYGATGNLQQVIQPGAGAGNAPVRTMYEYDGFNRLTTVTMPRGSTTQRRQFQYGANGKIAEKRQVESGAVSYTYNADLTMASKKDALGQVVTYQYDSFKRLTSVTRAGSDNIADPSQATFYYYDSQPFSPGFSQNTVGRLAAARWGTVDSPSGRFTEMYSYDSAGRTRGTRLSIERPQGTLSLDTAYSYDSNGRLQSIAYPGSLGKFSYSYDELGRASGLTSDSGAVLVRDVAYTPKGDISSIKRLIPGTSDYYAENRTYNSRAQVTAISAGPETPTKDKNWMQTVDLRYTYHPTRNDGKARVIEDAVAGEKVFYTYDDRGRLVSAENTSEGSGLKFQYDEFNNLITQQPIDGATAGLQNAVDPNTNRVVHPSVVYDANGNMIQTGGATMKFDIENRLVSVTSPGADEQYAYNPSGDRIWTRNAHGDEELAIYGPGNRKLAVFALQATTDGVAVSAGSANLYFNGRLVYSNDAVVVTDPVNSVRARIGAAQSPQSDRFSYFPFGEDNPAGSSHKLPPRGAAAAVKSAGGKDASVPRRTGFAGAEYSGNTMFAYAKRRNYDTTMARFLSPDQAGVRLQNPETWNKYTFLNNDPVNAQNPADLAPDWTSQNDGSGSHGGGGSYTTTQTVSTSYSWTTESSYNYTTNYTYTEAVVGGMIPDGTAQDAFGTNPGLMPEPDTISTIIFFSVTQFIPSVGEAEDVILVSRLINASVKYVSTKVIDAVIAYYVVKALDENAKKKEQKTKR